MKKAGIPTTVEELRLKWAKLHDLDRAALVKSLRAEGKSLRAIAAELGCSDGLLRYLLDAAKAPPPDHLLARQGKISTRELVRRSKQSAKAEAEKARARDAERRSEEAKKWGTAICTWLQEQVSASAHRENIIEEARWELHAAELSGTLPKVDVPKGLSLDAIIDQTRPSESGWEQSLWIYRFVSWLAHWTLWAIPDSNIRYLALSEALVRTRRQEDARPSRARLHRES